MGGLEEAVPEGLEEACRKPMPVANEGVAVADEEKADAMPVANA